MHEIKCPHCQTVFKVDESGYTNIANQIRNQEFDKELHKLESQLEASKQSELKLLSIEKDKQIESLQVELQNSVDKRPLEIQNALIEKEKELESLAKEKDRQITELTFQLQSLTEKQPLEIQNALSKAQHELETLRLTHQNELAQALSTLEKERDDLKNQLSLSEKERELDLQSLQKNYENQLKTKDEEVAFYKDFKAKQSTKMIGESLENYAEQAFNKLRATAFKTAYFEKDNDAKTGSKGDFIFKDFDDGLEYISIMFEMKNEQDTTATKHKNKDFFKELDKDRREKNCEYAVLVSMLEADDDFYNTGIVEVVDYDKMYVVRPQFFIQIISILRNAALSSLQYKKELSDIKNREIDITNFEQELNLFRDNFGVTAKNFNNNLEKLDKNLEDSIKKLTTARDELRKAMKNLGTAENKLDNLTVKRLTRNNPTMQAKFDELN